MSRTGWLKSRRRVWAVCFVIAMIATPLIIYAVVLKSRYTNNIQTAGISLCSTDEIGNELKDKYPVLSSDNTDSMADLVEKIRLQEQYKKSPHCLVVLTKYYFYTGNYEAVINHHETLEQVYESSGQWVDESISQETPEQIALFAESARQHLEAFRHNTDVGIPRGGRARQNE